MQVYIAMCRGRFSLLHFSGGYARARMAEYARMASVL